VVPKAVCRTVRGYQHVQQQILCLHPCQRPPNLSRTYPSRHPCPKQHGYPPVNNSCLSGQHPLCLKILDILCSVCPAHSGALILQVFFNTFLLQDIETYIHLISEQWRVLWTESPIAFVENLLFEAMLTVPHCLTTRTWTSGT
jgi:hypothetical protein